MERQPSYYQLYLLGVEFEKQAEERHIHFTDDEYRDQCNMDFVDQWINGEDKPEIRLVGESGYIIAEDEQVPVNPPVKAETINVRLTPENFPIAFQRKVKELMKQGAFETQKEAEDWLKESPITLELYYDIDSGLYAVESEAVECISTEKPIVSPYTGKPMVTEE